MSASRYGVVARTPAGSVSQSIHPFFNYVFHTILISDYRMLVLILSFA
jgi:hypothetical protein